MHVNSELEFPELYPANFTGRSDLTVRLGDVPKIPEGSISFHNDYYDIGPEIFRITVEGVGTYYAKNGNEIIISPEISADHSNIRIYCLSNAYAAILQQQKKIPLHCAAILVNDKLVLIFGQSGAGKSSALGSLMRKGYPVFSDDVCVPLDISSEQMKLFSSYPMLKFWRNTLEGMKMNHLTHRRIRPGIEKFGIYFHENFITEPKTPFLTIILEESAEALVPDVQKISGALAFQKLEEHAYRNEYLFHSGLKKEHFTAVSKLAAQTKTYVLRRPKDRNSIQEVVNLIEQVISSE
jgi:hypothetical protein